MFRIFMMCLTLLLICGCPPSSFALFSQPAHPTLSQLEHRLEELDNELRQLARLSLRSGIGSIGYRSRYHRTPSAKEWVEIELESETPIDEIMLIPTIYRDPQQGFQADGFPDKFKVILCGQEGRTVLGEYDSGNHAHPRLAPFIIPAGGLNASSIRIEATQLGQRVYDLTYILQLAEIMIFSQGENVALRQPVTTSSPNEERPGTAWRARYMVDGHTPYLMDSAQGHKSVAFVSRPGTQPAITIDLEQSFPLSRIQLHALDQSDTVPQAYAGDLGLPKHLLIEGAQSPDFSDALPLLNFQQKDITDTGPIMMWPIPETRARYIRISSVALETNPVIAKVRMGFAEIELFAHGKNVARNKTATAKLELPILDTNRRLTNLTDGQNLYGKILPIQQWMNELSRRQQLETERPLLIKELNQHYTRQKKNLRRMIWFSACLVAGSTFIILLSLYFRQRAIFRTRERIAANLHDELGANLHAIGLLGDYAKKIVLRKNAQHEWNDLMDVMAEVRELTEETGATARYCTNMLEAKEVHENLIGEMKHNAERLLTDLDHEMIIQNEAMLQLLKPRKRTDLYLFYKECLINIIRHSGATKVITQLTVLNRQIRLIITDNGHGVGHLIPSSLKRRARLLGGNLKISPPENGGTRISLTVSLKKCTSQKTPPAHRLRRNR